LAAIFGNVLAPLYYKGIIDALTNTSLNSKILYFFLMLFLMNGGQYLFSRLYEYLESSFISNSLYKISTYSLSELTKHSYQFFTNNFAGSLVSKARKFGSAFERIWSTIITDFLFAFVSAGGILFVLFKTSNILGLATLLWFVVFSYLTIVFTRLRMPLEKIKGLAESRTTGVLSDILSNVLNLKIFSSKNKEEIYFDEVVRHEHVVRMNSWAIANHAYSVQGLVTLLAQVSLVFLSLLLWSYGEVTSGTIVLVMSYSSFLFNRLGSLGRAVRSFSDAYTDATEFADILNKELEISDPSKPERVNMQLGEIIFDKVSFSYKQSNEIIQNFNLKISSGERLGIIGTSGAGKTTLTKLLLRFADVTEGSIKIDGQDIRDITQDDLRRVVSYVPQDPILFHRSLKENIAYGKPKATSDEIIDASKRAHAHDFISTFLQGYDALVGERGIKLSGGERQRVAIARAILKDAPILILDEATSSLDSVSEAHIKEALDELMKGRTTIVVAHRLSTIEKMDRIIVLEKGEIVEEGTHNNLLAKKGVYFNFWNHQTGGFIE